MAQINDIAVDLGTSHVLIYMRGKGIVLREPAVVSIDRDSRKVLAVGTDAYRMIGRTPSNILAVRPLRQGVISDFDLTNTMLRQFVMHVIGRHWFSRPRAIMSVPSGVTDNEKHALCGVMFDAGMRKTQLIERPLAAALGIGMRFGEAYGTMIIDMGAGMSDIAVLAMNEIVVSCCVPIGGDYFDDAIIRYLRKKHNLLIGERTAEEVKISIGSATKPQGTVTMDVTGRHLVAGLPRTIIVTADEIYEALRDPVADLVEAIQSVIERTPAQLASDVFKNGIVLTGGAAQLTGLSEAIYHALGIACGVADDPQTSVATGCGLALDETPAIRKLLIDDKRRWGR